MNRCRLEAQGYRGYSEGELRSFGPWLRFAPTLCAIGMALGTALASPSILWVVGATALWGAIGTQHPFEVLYMQVVRPLFGTPAIPESTTERRFACGMASVWLAGTALAFQLGATASGYLLGAILTVVAAIVSTTDFCIPSLIYGLLFSRTPEEESKT